MFISSLNSGSNGNCYYIGNQQEAVLVDAGLTCRETENRMVRAGLNFARIKAIFITHEHTDHTRGADVISRKYQIPIYLSPGTYKGSRILVNHEHVRLLTAYSPVQIGNLTVNAFPKKHDATEPQSFTVTGNGVTIGVFTDLGKPCKHVINNFKLCNAAFLEANYDEEMLEKGGYPQYLKDRIRSDHGHLSNYQALELFIQHKGRNLSHLLLSHLSQDNNNPQIAKELFNRHTQGTIISVASRHVESPVYHITGTGFPGSLNKVHAPSANTVQMKLFSDSQ
ncbi:MAG: MBL fold metallo-hydrolase [Bacteroidales bacterium]